MIRNTLFSVTALAVLSGTASAGGYTSDIRYDGHKFICHFERHKVKVGYDWYGHPIFKWKRKKICETVYY